MKSKKQSVIIIRLTDAEKLMVKKLREEKSINLSSLVRNFIRDYYEKNNGKKE